MQPSPRILLRFAHPEPPRGPRPRVHPVFLPFAGCPQRCVYCDQRAQTGQTGLAGRPPEALEDTLARVRREVLTHAEPVELAFYGGTFTAQPRERVERLLALAGELRAAGKVSRVRCSTRPDCVGVDCAEGGGAGPELLARLGAQGLDLVELGVQSFQDAALSATRRGYAGDAAAAACRLVRAAGLGLGIQLLPGMPGHGPGDLARDVESSAGLAPEFVRLYPCLVLEGTELAEMWRAGDYEPWPLEETVEALARSLLVLWAAGIPAARVGLADQPGLSVLAGPRHPALGQMARARAFFLHVRGQLAACATPPPTLFVPSRWQGEVLGQGNALEKEYAALGLRVEPWGEREFGLGG